MNDFKNQDIDRIINETFDFLRETGIKFDKNEEIFELLKNVYLPYRKLLNGGTAKEQNL